MASTKAALAEARRLNSMFTVKSMAERQLLYESSVEETRKSVFLFVSGARVSLSSIFQWRRSL